MKLNSSLNKFREYKKELEKEIIINDEYDTSIVYNAVDRDDFNTYTIGLVSEVVDTSTLSDLLRDIADYLDNTDEAIDRITISYKG